MSNIFGTSRPGALGGWSIIGDSGLRVYNDPQNIITLAKDVPPNAVSRTGYVRDVGGSVTNNSITASLSCQVMGNPSVGNGQHSGIGLVLHDSVNDGWAWYAFTRPTGNFPVNGEFGQATGANSAPFGSVSINTFFAASAAAWLRIAWDRVDASNLNVRLFSGFSEEFLLESELGSVNVNPRLVDVDKVGFYVLTSNTTSDGVGATATLYSFAETGAIA